MLYLRLERPGVSSPRLFLVLKPPHRGRPLSLAGLRAIFRYHRKVAQRPGKPMWFGARSGGPVVFAFPGNPVSALVCFIRYALPFFDRLLAANPGGPEPVRLAEELTFDKPLTLFRPVSLQPAPDDLPRASASAYKGSGDLHVLAVSDGFVEMPAETNSVPAGAPLPFYRWP